MKVISLVQLVLGAAFLLVGLGVSSCNITHVPLQPETSCEVSDREFAGWFENGKVELDGAVRPFDGTSFLPKSRLAQDACDFFKWSEQMFLWLLSPAPPRYGGGGKLVFQSAPFFDVSTANKDGKRTFISHEAGLAPILQLEQGQLLGPNDLPIVMDKHGARFESIGTADGLRANPLISNQAGEKVGVGRISVDAEGRPTFFDLEDREIREPKPILKPGMHGRFVQEFKIDDHVSVFLDSEGEVVEAALAQAWGKDVLMTQDDSLVYYMITVNDAYVYFHGKEKSKGPEDEKSPFPTTHAEINALQDFVGTNYGAVALVDPEALIVEIKTSWVRASSLSISDSEYVTIQGVVPVFDKSLVGPWKQIGEETVELAMIGMHVVGTVEGHPEMLWGTFEHHANAPNDTYEYLDFEGMTQTVPLDTSGLDFLLCEADTTENFNLSHMTWQGSPDGLGDQIKAVGDFEISSSNTVRRFAWGSDGDKALNSKLINLNNSVRHRLLFGDVREKYLQIGTVWTNGRILGIDDDVEQLGCLKLCNATMETYFQGDDKFEPNVSSTVLNCIGCHNVNEDHPATISKVFDDLEPLF